jgi:hypothetical protein
MHVNIYIIHVFIARVIERSLDEKKKEKIKKKGDSLFKLSVCAFV